MKRMSFLQTLIFIFLCSSFSFSKIHYVSNDGSINGNGSLTNPFNRISTAYNAAVLNGQNEVIKLMPGNYYESEILIFNNKKITISGYGDQSIINNNIIVKSDMSFANLYIQGSFSNESFVVFDNVKCDDTCIDVESITGTWRGKENEMHINFLSDPKDDLEVVNYLTLSNYVTEADLATKDNINTEIAARETADSQLSADIISATNGVINTVKRNYVDKSGDIMTGTLNINNNSIIQSNGNIGIGTINPQAKLDINMTKNGNALRLLGLNKDFKLHLGHDGNIVGYYWLYKGSGSGNNNVLELWTQNVHNPDKQVYKIYQDGNIGFLQNVGIGTTSPKAKLDVNGKIKSTQTVSGDSGDTVTTKTYVDNKKFSSANISIGAITETKIACGAVTVDKLNQDIDDKYLNADGGDTITSGSLTFSNAYGNGIVFKKDGNKHVISTDGGNFNFLTSQIDQNGNCGYWWRMKNPAENNGNYYHALWLTRRQAYSNYTHNTALRLFHPLLMNDEQIHFLADPADPQDAATKSYVDNAVMNNNFSNRSARVTIAKDVDFVQVMDSRINTNSIIMVTPESAHDEGFYQYWVEPGNGSFNVYREPTNSEWKFNFFITKF